MNLSPTIVFVNEKKLIGKSMMMSFADYRVAELWRNFGPEKNRISTRLNDDMISMTNYQENHFQSFDTKNRFKKWAAVEVTSFDVIDSNLEKTIIPKGNYAVFHHRGKSSNHAIFEYIYGTWIPNSRFEIDLRPHFEVLGPNYKINDANALEDIYIPIKNRV